jgi:putative peptidoglycan lipid II flippase
MNVLRSSAIYSLFTSISRIFGFLRDILIANFLGTGVIADIFFVAFRLPNTFRRIFSEGALNSAFVPIYTKLIKDNFKQESKKFAGSILLIFFITSSIFVLVIEIFMPFFITILAPGFTNDNDKFIELVKVSRIIFPFLILISVASIFSSILNSHSKFALSAALPVILNITLIIAIVIAAHITADFLLFLSWGVIIAGLIQVIFLTVALIREKIYFIFSLKIYSNYIKRFTKLFTASFFSSGLLQINILIGTIIASYESGAISYLYYADRIYQLPLALIGIAIGTAMLPSISSKIKSDRLEIIHKSIEKTLLYSLLFAVPASVGVYALSEQIIAVLFERGEFDDKSVLYTSNALKFYSLGLVAFIFMKIYTPIFFAHENARPTLYIAVINLVVNTILSIVLFSSLGFIGIPIATSISAWLSILFMNYYLKKHNYYQTSKKMILPTTIIIITSFIMYLYLSFLKNYTGLFLNLFQDYEIIFLLFSVLSSILLYFILISFYKPFKYSEIKKILQNE